MIKLVLLVALAFTISTGSIHDAGLEPAARNGMPGPLTGRLSDFEVHATSEIFCESGRRGQRGSLRRRQCVQHRPPKEWSDTFSCRYANRGGQQLIEGR